MRSYDNNEQKELSRLMDDCARGVAIATQCTFEKSYFASPYESLRINGTGVSVLSGIFGELGLTVDPDDTFAVTDVGDVSRVCPVFHPCLKLTPHDVTIHQKEFADHVIADSERDPHCTE